MSSFTFRLVGLAYSIGFLSLSLSFFSYLYLTFEAEKQIPDGLRTNGELDDWHWNDKFNGTEDNWWLGELRDAWSGDESRFANPWPEADWKPNEILGPLLSLKYKACLRAI